MKIYLENFRKYEKLLISISQKGNQLYESIYLDFDNCNAYVFSQGSSGRVSFMWEETEKDEITENFFIPLDSFLVLAKQFDSLEIRNKIFYNGNESFEFASFKDEVDLDNYKNASLTENSICIESNTEFLDIFKIASKYCDENENSALNGVFVRNDCLVASDRKKFYEATLKNKYGNINIPFSVCKILLGILKNETFYLTKKDNLIFLKIKDELDIVISDSKVLEIPDTKAEEFINMYNHKNSFIVNTNTLSDVLKFLDSFTKDIPNQRIFVEISEENKMLILNVKDFNKIKREVKLENISQNFGEQSFWISSSYLKNAVEDCKDEKYKTIKFQFCEKNPAINISICKEDKAELDFHIVLIQMKDE